MLPDFEFDLRNNSEEANALADKSCQLTLIRLSFRKIIFSGWVQFVPLFFSIDISRRANPISI